MKVVLIRSTATHPGVHKLAKTLSRNGHDVKLLVWDRERKYPKVEKIDSYTVHRFRLKTPYGKIAVLLYLPIWWLYELYFFLREDPDVVHACDLDTLPPAIVAKFLKRTRLCYTIYDLYGGAFPGPIPTAVRNLATFIERVSITFTDILFLITESFEEALKGARIKKVVYIYNSPEDYSDMEFTAMTTSEIRIFYGGSIAGVRGIKDMIDAISDMDGIKFVLAGSELDKDIVKYGMAKLEEFEYLGFIPHKEVIRRSLAADILFLFADPKLLCFRHATPNKLFEAMMCSKPIIVSDGAPMSKIVRAEGCGIVVPYGDIAAIKEAVLRLINDPVLREKLGRNGRRAYETSYSWEIMESRLINAYKELAN